MTDTKEKVNELQAKSLDDFTWELAHQIQQYTTDKLQAAALLGDSNSSHLRAAARYAKAELERRGVKP